MKAKNKSITKRLVMYFVWIILIPIIFVSIIMNYSYRNSVMQLAVNSIQDSLDIIDNNLTRQFSRYGNLSYFISRDQQLQQMYAYSPINTESCGDEHWRRMSELLNAYRTSVNGVEQIAIAYDNGKILLSDDPNPLFEDATNERWYQICKNEPDKVQVINHMRGETPMPGVTPLHSEMISVCRAIEDKDGNFIGVIRLAMFSFVLAEPMSNILNSEGSYVYIIGPNDEIVYSPVVQTISDHSDSTRFCSAERYNELNQWRIVGVLSMSDYTREMNTISRIMAIIVVIVVILMGAASITVGRSIVRPIASLRQLMRQAEKGDLTVRFITHAPDEIQALGDSFNHMIQQLDASIKQVYDEQKAKKKAEIAALQANIKPHFLYNTLDTIHWMAKSYQATDIIETVDALSTLFRVSLSKGSETISVEQELLHVSSYLQIQKVRYEDMIEYEVHVTDECRHLKVQKLILQPLVENAIYHGIKESGQAGTIEISVWRTEDMLMMMVTDTGKGMSEERLSEVKAVMHDFKPKKDGAYGVVNVHKRIVLSYGTNYGLFLNSEDGAGTVALICHPIITEGTQHD